jgi:hypothetical protein
VSQTSSAEVLPSLREAISFREEETRSRASAAAAADLHLTRVAPALRAVVGGCRGEAEAVAS